MGNWKKYAIMHKDRKVASINSDGACIIYYPSFMPYNLYLEESENIDDRLNNLVNFYAWCSSRVLTLDRKYVKEILNSLKMKQATTDKERAQIALLYHCVSMIDVFWVKGFREKLTFKDVNLFNNNLSDAFVDVSLRGKSLTVANSELLYASDYAPDLSTQGVAPKAWIRRNKNFYLLKDGLLRDIKAEVLASKILDCFDIEHVNYEQSEFKHQPVSKCKIITSEERSIVSAEYVEIYAINHDKDLRDIVFENSFKAYHMMNIMDYLVGNNDRHWENWGFWVNNKNNRIETLYPLMDFNKAFSAYSNIEGAICLPEGNMISQKDAAINAVKLVGLNQKKSVKREWFDNEKTWKMFQKRLELLKTYDK